MSERDEPMPDDRPDPATIPGTGGPSVHPEELLAGYVDGTATAVERTEVDEHLALCARCREEVALAGAAVAALRTLPELESPWDGAVPLRTTDAVAAGRQRPSTVASLADRRARRARIAWRGGAVAVAAAVVGLLIYLGPFGGGHAATTTAPASASTAPSAQKGAEDQLAALAQHLAGTSREPANTLVPSASGGTLATQPSATEDACLRSATGVPPAAFLLHFERTAYQGQPAYVIGYLTASSADRSGRVVVAAVSRPGCALIHLIRVPVGPSP